MSDRMKFENKGLTLTMRLTSPFSRSNRQDPLSGISTLVPLGASGVIPDGGNGSMVHGG